jgi:hypothetical protein
MKIRAWMLLLCVPLIAGVIFAHNGMEHVMGKVKAMTANSITVETAAQDPKTITVALVSSTRFVKGGADATLKDLKVGDRVMVEAKENSPDKLEAVTVNFGKQPPHDATK